MPGDHPRVPRNSQSRLQGAGEGREVRGHREYQDRGVADIVGIIVEVDEKVMAEIKVDKVAEASGSPQ